MKGLRPGKPVQIIVTYMTPLTPSQATQHLRNLGFNGDLEERLRSMAAKGQIEVTYSVIRVNRHGKIDPGFWQTSTDRKFEWRLSRFEAVVEDNPGVGGGPWDVAYEGVRFVFDNVKEAIPEPDSDGTEGSQARPRGRPRDEARWEQVTAALLRLGVEGRLDPSNAKFISTRTALATEIRHSRIWSEDKSEPPSSKVLQPVVDRLCELGGVSIR